MPRDLSDAILTAVTAGTVRPVYMAAFEFAQGTVYTATAPVTYDGNDYADDGFVRQWPTITESLDLSANNIDIAVNSTRDQGFDLNDPAQYRARSVEIFIAFPSGPGVLPADRAYRLFSGRMSQVSYEHAAENTQHRISAESRLVDLARPKPLRYTHQTQIQRWPQDRGLEYAGAAQTKLYMTRGEKPDKPFARKVVYGRTLVEGSPVFVTTSGSGSRYLNLVVAFAGHQCDAIEQLYLDDRPVLDTAGNVSGEFVDVVEYHPHLGLDDQAADAALIAEVGSPLWTTDHRLRGITYAYLRILYSEDLFGDDAPSVSARIRGKPLYDPRDQTTAWSDNAALAVRDYLLNEDYGFSSGAEEIDDDSVAVAANDCDDPVDLASGETEARYTVNGWLDTEESIGKNLQTLLNAQAGKLTYIGGTFALYAGAYKIGNTTIQESHVVGPVQFSNANLREAFNGARGLYRTPELQWQDEDYPPYENAAARTVDGEPRVLDLPLPLTTSPARCQRIAKLSVMRSRRARSVSVPLLFDCFTIRAGDLLAIAVDAIKVEGIIYQARELSIHLADNAPRIEIRMRETHADDYAWDPDTEETEITVPEAPADSILAWTLARLASPSASPGSHTFVVAPTVTVAHNETGVTCYYTLDGSAPTEADTAIANGGTIQIPTDTTVLKLKSFQDDGSLTSEVVTYEYTYNPPTVRLVSPAPRWGFYWNRLEENNVSPAAPRPRWLIQGSQHDTSLYSSSNGGVNWSVLTTDADPGEEFTAGAVNSAYTPSSNRAFIRKTGYIDSSHAQMPNQAIPVQVGSYEGDTGSVFTQLWELGVVVWGTNARLWTRERYDSNDDNIWGAWSSWYVLAGGLSWGAVFDDISIYFKNRAGSNNSKHQREYYLEQTGYQNSIITRATGYHGGASVEYLY